MTTLHAAGPETQNGEKILVVDDNPTNLRVLVQTLDGQHYRLLVAKTGEDALSIAKKTRPDLVLLDVMMPGLNGYEVCQRLKVDPDTRDAAVIFLSALGDTHDKVQGLQMGAVDYVGKPFQTSEVVARVKTHLSIRRLQRTLDRQNTELEHANHRMKRDLDAAARVQRALLPEAAPPTDRARFAWAYRPCDELAGDALNVFPIDDRYIGLYVVDVSGHGVPSALLSVSVARHLMPPLGRASLVTDTSPRPPGYVVARPSEVAARLNRLYQMDSRNLQYFTLLYGVLDTYEGQFRYVTAGHPGPVRVREGEPVQTYCHPAIPIGMMGDSTYADSTIDVSRGDRLYLYSDGVTEETDHKDEPFGLDRLSDTLDTSRSTTVEESVHALVGNVVGWRGDARLSDDLSVLAVEML